jgi:hypothetical protein
MNLENTESWVTDNSTGVKVDNIPEISGKEGTNIDDREFKGHSSDKNNSALEDQGQGYGKCVRIINEFYFIFNCNIPLLPQVGERASNGNEPSFNLHCVPTLQGQCDCFICNNGEYLLFAILYGVIYKGIYSLTDSV